MLVKLDLHENKDLNQKLKELFCSHCTRTGPGRCVGCSLEVDIEIEEVPTHFENGCEHLGHSGHCYFCKEKGGPGYMRPQELCKGCEIREKEADN